MNRKIYYIIMAIALSASGIIFWACTKEKNFLSDNNYQSQNTKKWGIDSSYVPILAENLHLSERIDECHQAFGVNIHEFCLNPHFTAIEEEMNSYFECFYERMQSMNIDDFSYLLETGNFDDELSLFIQYAENGQLEEAYQVYGRIATIIHCDWDSTQHFTYNGNNYNIPVQNIQEHQYIMQRSMRELYADYPVLNNPDQEITKKILQTAFLASTIYYNKGINTLQMIPFMRDKDLVKLQKCYDDSFAAYEDKYEDARAYYAFATFGCGFLTPPAGYSCGLIAGAIFLRTVRAAKRDYNNALDNCNTLYK